MKQALTDQQIQAIVAQVSAGDTGMTAEQATAAVTAAVTAALAAAKPAVETPVASATDAVVAMLQGQLTAANTQITALTVKATGLESQIAAHAAQAATLDALTKVVGTSLNQMKVSLGFSGFDASTLTAEQLVAEHTTTGETFAKKFPVGGVAAVGAPDPAAEKTPDPMYAARVAAARVAPQLKK